jgi:hypothetical protein
MGFSPFCGAAYPDKPRSGAVIAFGALACRPASSRPSDLSDCFRSAEVFGFHCHSAATLADKFHGGQFVFAHVLGIRFRSAAKAAAGFVVTRVAQMTGCVGHGATVLAGVRHGVLHFDFGFFLSLG